MNNPKSLSIKSSVTSDGLPESSTVNKPYIFNRNVGYQMLWHNNLGTLPTNIDGNGITTFTQYDITDPDVRESWEKVLSAYVPAQADKNYTNLGYCLANEPHWFLQQGHWATAKKFDGSQGLGTDSLALFTEYAENKYSTIDAANEAWGTSFTSFEDATSKVIPISTSYRNSVLWYDVCNWNMQRASNWLTFLNDQVISNDASALTHLKVMPDLWVESNRTHGIDLEAMTDMTGMIGNDAKIRGKNFKAGSDESWSDSYAYYWKEMMSYDFMSSVSPNKSNINTESHFLSTTQFRDLYMTPEYVNSTYWLATLLGMDANLTWFWGREPDGSVESRLIGDSGMNALGEAYAASVAQQPRVANQVYQTMTDINTFASEVTEIQEQKKPIRIFYSETSAIINEDYMENQYDMYQNLFFNGFPIGFATQNIIDKQDNKLWDVIVVYNTPNVTDTEFNALQTYLNKGGTVILDSISLKYDENHKNRSAVLKEGKGKLISVDKTVDEIASQAIGCVDMSNFSPIKLSESNGLEQKGCMWRVIPSDNGKYTMSILNIGKNTATINISAYDKNISSVTDMFTQQARTTNFTIESEGVMMLEITLTDKPTDSVKPTESTKPTNPVELTNQITSKNVTATIENTASVSSKESNDISSPSTGDNDLDNKMIFIFALSIVGGALIITKRKKQGIQ